MISGWRHGAGQAPSAWYFAGSLFVVNSCFIRVFLCLSCVCFVFILTLFGIYFVFILHFTQQDA